MKGCMFLCLLTLVLGITLILTSTTEALDLGNPDVYDFAPFDSWSGLEFAGNNVLIGAKGQRLYRFEIAPFGDSIKWEWISVGADIREIAIPRDNPFFVAYLKDDHSIGMRYTSSGLSWRGGFEHDATIDGIAIADDGDHLVSTGYDRLVVWNVDDPSAELKEEFTMNLDGDRWPVNDIAMSESDYIFVADGQWTEKWGRITGYKFRMDSGDDEYIFSLDHEAGYIASSCAGFIDIWSLNNGSFIRTLWMPDGDRGNYAPGLAFSKDARYVAAAIYGSKTLHVWNRSSGSRIETHTMGENPWALAFSPNSNFIAVGSTEGRIYIFNNRDVAGAPANTTVENPNPEQTTLLANYPNPFNPETWIPYQLAEPAEVTVTIHAADGKRIRTLDLGQRQAGVYQSKEHAAYWDGKNEQGEPVASGVYFYTLKAGEFSATKKMLIRK